MRDNFYLGSFQWFNSEVAASVQDVDEKLQILKFKAELNYFKKRYSEALDNFDTALGKALFTFLER